jgi:hypothetical protein
MKQKLRGFFLVLAFLGSVAGAQETKPLIKLNPLFIDGIGIEESRLIESLIRSYLSDIGELIIYFDSGLSEDPFAKQENVLDSWARTPDYTINGSIHLERDGRIFLLEVLNTRTGETYKVTSIYKSTGELVLKARSILESAFFAEGKETEKSPRSLPERINENLVVGTWRGEPGIEMIRLQRGGRGVAVFSSGAQMVLSYIIDDTILRVWQISPNSERFYYPLPLNAAKQLAAGAEPMAWELSLYQKGSILGGVKLATGVRMEKDQVAELLPGGDVREVIWTKTSH